MGIVIVSERASRTGRNGVFWVVHKAMYDVPTWSGPCLRMTDGNKGLASGAEGMNVKCVRSLLSLFNHAEYETSIDHSIISIAEMLLRN